MSSRILTARQWLGVSFAPYGRTRDGIDCVGLMLVVLEGGVSIPAYDIRDGKKLVDTVRSLFKLIRQPVAGSIALIKPRPLALPQHLGLICGSTMIHCLPKCGVIEEPYRGAMKRLTHSVWDTW